MLNCVQKPLKKLPSIMFYQMQHEWRGEKAVLYRMIDTKEGSLAGEMVAHPKRKNLFQKELWIEALVMRMNHRNKGFGTKMLNFAKNVSKQLGLKGRLGVRAATLTFTSNTPPHKFYREFGFTSSNKNLLKTIDEHIKNGKTLDYNITPPLEMHYLG